MNKEELFNKVKNVIDKAFDDMEKGDEKKIIYKSNYNYAEDIKTLKEDIYSEIDNCYKNIKDKEKLINDIEEKILIESDKNKHDLFVILPIFNATNEQAERCIYSIIDNFYGLDYKLLVMSNRVLDVFNSEKLNNISRYIYLKHKFSLPEVYNKMVGYAKENYIDENSLICLMDDDAFILTGQNYKIKKCIDKVKANKFIAVSGHYYDITPCKTAFEKMINQTHTPKFVNKYKKPFCHGGACFIIKIKNFPFNGLPITGLGGISINILSIEKNKKHKWFLYNDTSLMVFHPRKYNIIAWIATYLSYEIAWGRALNMLNENDRKKWKKKLVQNSKNRVGGLYIKIKNNDERIYALGNLFITRYLKPLLLANLEYEEFKKFNISTHINLK